MGMGGVQRITKFCKYLPEFGWQPTVVTVKNTVYYSFDETLLDEIQKTKIYRTESLDPLRIAFKLGAKKEIKPNSNSQKSTLNFFADLLLPDNKILWTPFAIQKAKELFKEKKFDAILTTSPPHSIHFIGLYLKRKFGIPWIVDFRDPWENGHLERVKNKTKKSILLRIEKKILRESDYIISVTPSATEAFASKLSSTIKDKFATITNGFDSEDFEAEKVTHTRKFTITYTGTISVHANPKKTLEALKILASEVGKEKILFKFVGTFTNGIYKEILKSFEDSVEIKEFGYLSHSKAISETLNSDVLLLLAEKNLTNVIPAKVFEYIATRKPILAILPESDTKAILKTIPNSEVCDIKDCPKILETLRKLYSQWENGELKQNKNDISSFERKNQTKKLVSILESLTNKKSSIQ